MVQSSSSEPCSNLQLSRTGLDSTFPSKTILVKHLKGKVLMKSLLLIALMAFCFWISSNNLAQAQALTAEQKVQLEKWQAALDDKSVTENSWPKEMCGKDLPAKIDPSLVAPFMAAGNEANYYCREVREKLSTICRNAQSYLKEGNKKDNKKLIGTLINKITCKISKGPEDDASFDLSKGELVVSLGAKASNISEKLLSYLYKKQGFNPGNQ